jgi:hypothetical protein
LVAYEPSVTEVEFGQTITRDSFTYDFVGSGFALDFVFNRNAITLTFTAASSGFFNLCVLLASLAGSVIGVFAFLTKRIESFFDFQADDDWLSTDTGGKEKLEGTDRAVKMNARLDSEISMASVSTSVASSLKIPLLSPSSSSS